MKEPLEIVPSGSSSSAPDPWGVRRAEMLLVSLKAVQSARVVVSPDGEILEIHVLTESSLTPKQVVRNVESALLAQLGIKVDHRRISVAQTENGKGEVDEPVAHALPDNVMTLHVPEPDTNGGRASDALAALTEAQTAVPGSGEFPAPETEAAPAPGPQGSLEASDGDRSVLFHNVEVSSIRPNKVRVTVTLEYAGQEVSADEDAADTPNMRLQAAARAAVAALDDVMDQGTLDLVGARFVEAFDTTFVFVGVSVLTGRDTALHTGTAEIRRGAEQAAAIGVLDATNRWLRAGM